jgi:hypothetical protein
MYKKFFFEIISSRFDEEMESSPPTWLRRCALLLLLDADWWRLGSSAVDAATQLFTRGSNCKDIALACGVPNSIAGLVGPLLLSYDTGKPDEVELRHGLIEAHYYKPARELGWKNWSAQIWNDLETSSGVLKTIFNVLNLVRSPTLPHLQTLRLDRGATSEDFRLLPMSVRSYISETAISDYSKPRDVLEQKFPGWSRTTTIADSPNERIDWKKMAREESWWVLYLLCQDREDVQDGFKKAENRELLIDSLLKDTSMLEFIRGWGALFNDLELLGPQLRHVALVNSAAPVQFHTFGGIIKWQAFRLRLPEEAAMLPHLLGMFINLTSTVGQYGRAKHENPQFGNISNLIASYGVTSEMLLRVGGNHNNEKRVRAAAIAMSFLLGDATAGEIPSKLTLVDLYEESEGHWFLPAAALILSDGIGAENRDALETMGALLERGKNDFDGRLAINKAIRDWREISGSPVQKNLAAGTWA